jgi:hypothetical protein
MPATFSGRDEPETEKAQTHTAKIEDRIPQMIAESRA